VNATELTTLLHKDIPITKQMGSSIIHVDEHTCIAEVELEPNLNHKGTAFGGSIYSCCALASYGLFLNGLRHHGSMTNNIVIAEGEIKYVLPVTDDFEVKAEWHSDRDRKKFFETLKSKKKARTHVTAKVVCQGDVCAEFKGLFVAKDI
jgi:thioesterase domain-containing protein